MNEQKTVRIGKRGTLVLPVEVRRSRGMEEGTLVIVEEREEGVLLRPAVAIPAETYTPERKAEFLLSNAVDENDYQAAREAVEALGLDPVRSTTSRLYSPINPSSLNSHTSTKTAQITPSDT